MSSFSTMRHLLFLLSLVVLLQAPRASFGKELASIKGKVLVPGTASPAHAVVHLITADGKLLKAFCDSDGSFTLSKVPKGSHLLQAQLIGFFYPEVRVDVGSKGNLIRSFFVAPNNQVMALQEPLMIRPVGEMQYYEKRKPLDLWGFVKSPYGIMIVFSVLVIFVFPKMKVDPEEYKQFQDQLKAPAPAASGGSGQQQARIQGK